MRLRLAHLSDPHLPLPCRPSLAELASKRIFGYANFVISRAHGRAGAVLDLILADIAAQAPDHVCVTGDLVNIATASEFRAARKFLERIGPPDTVSVVPGNHDAYVPGAARRAIAAWAPYVAGDGPPRFPAVRRIGPVALISVSTAVATAPLIASGRVGATQLAQLAALLDRHDDAVKVVMIHHPPDPALSSGRRGLSDVARVREVLAAGCVDIVLHGHTHEPSLTALATARGAAVVVGVPSASSDGTRHAPAGYAIVDVMPGLVRITRRVADGPAMRTASVEERALAAPVTA